MHSTLHLLGYDHERSKEEEDYMNKKQEEIRLYRILDIGYSANLIQRIFGIGTISLRTSDKSAGSIDLINVKDAMTVKKLLSDYVEKERKANRVAAREFMADDEDGEEDI